MNVPTLSYSALKDYKTCPQKFYRTRITKEFASPPTDATRYGERLHKAAEDWVRHNKPLEPEFRFLKSTLAALCRKPGDKYPELKMAVTVERRPCAFDDPDAWLRGIADLVIVNEPAKLAHVVDYKTGNDKYYDMDQLRLMALFIFAKFPEVDTINGALLFVVKNRMYKMQMHRRECLNENGWMRFAGDVARIHQSFSSASWTATPSGLCRNYCPVRSCPHNGGYE